jgi:hypothetical protein
VHWAVIYIGFQFKTKIQKLAMRLGSQRRQISYFAFGIYKKFKSILRKKYVFKYFYPNFHSVIGNIDFLESLNKTIPLPNLNNYSDWILNNEKSDIIKIANQILDNKFDIFNQKKVLLNPIPWHTDINSGYIWEKGKFYLDYKQVDLSNNADVKYPRELSRSHFLLYLSQAYLLTKQEKYAEKVISIIENWIDENPLMRSINWGCTMDVAIRGINYLYAIRLIEGSKHLNSEFLKKFSVSTFGHSWFIYNNQEYNFENNANHYDSNIVSLLIYGKLFSNSSFGKKIYNHALEEYYHEVRQQILPSGVIYEKSINYGRLVCEMFTHAYSFLKSHNVFIPNDITYRIKSSIEYIYHYTMPNGLSPIIGDLDDARWLPFTPIDRLNHTHLLSVGAALFKDEVLKSKSMGYISDVFFHNNKLIKEDFDNIDSFSEIETSKDFSDAGYYIMRTPNVYLFINNAGLSKYQDINNKKYFGSHTHADLLSFDLSYKDKNIIVDPGSYCYTSNPREKNLFRSTEMHNTLTVDKRNQLEISDEQLFGFESYISPNNLQWKSTDEIDHFIGEHNGYERIDKGIIHRREIQLNKRTDSILIQDEVKGLGVHDINLYFHFEAGVNFIVEENQITTKNLYEKEMNLSITSSKPFKIYKEKSFVSKSYNMKEDSFNLRIEFLKVSLPFKIISKIDFIITNETT